MKICLYVLTLLGMAGCSNMFGSRSFQEEMDRDSDGIWSANEDFPVVAGDTGKAHRTRRDIYARTPSSVTVAAKEFEREKLEEEVNAKLESLSEDELKDYQEAEKYFESDSEKIYYLSLSKSKRKSYVMDKSGRGLGGVGEYSTLDYLKLRESRNSRLDLGMSKDDVVSKMGRPGEVNIAGDPRNENERWAYGQGSSRKYIYFEGGKVQGWSQD